MCAGRARRVGRRRSGTDYQRRPGWRGLVGAGEGPVGRARGAARHAGRGPALARVRRLMDTVSEPPVDEEIAGHYRTGYERERLGGGTSRIEFARTKELLQRFLPHPRDAVLDVGVGPGASACVM